MQHINNSIYFFHIISISHIYDKKMYTLIKVHENFFFKVINFDNFRVKWQDT